MELLLPLTAPDGDSSSEWTVDGIIQEAQQSIADDQPVEQQHQVSAHCHDNRVKACELPRLCWCFESIADSMCTRASSPAVDTIASKEITSH